MSKFVKSSSIGKTIARTLKSHGIRKAGIFGSYARGEQTKKSDIDVLIEFDGSLIALVGLERELQEKMGIKVDLLTYRGVHPLLRKRIRNEEVRIL